MDRLPAVTASLVARLTLVAWLACATAGCDDGAAPAPQSRVVAVAADPADDPAAGFCDVRPDGAPPLALPPLAEGQNGPSGAGRRWLNVWATWCAPCVEEMPRLIRWRDRLADEGVDVELVFVSADRDAQAVAAFRAEHPEMPTSLRLSDPDALAGWAPQVGLDEGATLPIHVLTDAQGRVRCARTGGVAEEHYPAARALLR